MKIAIAGKGGSGKTTVSSGLARILARRGLDVLAIDVDTDPNLGVSLGLGCEEAFCLTGLRQSLQGTEEDAIPGIEELVARHATEAPDGVRLLQVSKIEHGSGCA